MPRVDAVVAGERGLAAYTLLVSTTAEERGLFSVAVTDHIGAVVPTLTGEAVVRFSGCPTEVMISLTPVFPSRLPLSVRVTGCDRDGNPESRRPPPVTLDAPGSGGDVRPACGTVFATTVTPRCTELQEALARQRRVYDGVCDVTRAAETTRDLALANFISFSALAAAAAAIGAGLLASVFGAPGAAPWFALAVVMAILAAVALSVFLGALAAALLLRGRLAELLRAWQGALEQVLRSCCPEWIVADSTEPSC